MTAKKNRCGEVKESDYTFLGLPFYFEEAPEPSNIIWENKFMRPRQHILRTCLVYAAIVGMLLICAIIFVAFKAPLNASHERYPPFIDCSHFDSHFKNTLSEEWKRFSDIDKERALIGQGNGAN